MVDYSLREVIENGNAPLIAQFVKGVKTIIASVIAGEKAQRRLELKARITLLMGISNEHQLNFNSIKDAKSLQQVVEKRFGGNAATKKTRRNLLKQQYRNFTAFSLENTHTIMWRNHPEIDTLSMDDLNKNLKIYKTKVKGTSSSNTNTNTQNVAFVSLNSTSNTNGGVNTAHGATTASTQATASIQATVVNSTTIDNLKEIDLRWQMAMLTIRARRFLKNTGRKFSLNGNETIGFDKSKVECYNCHKMRHFARVCRALRSQDTKHKESIRRTVSVETPASASLVSCDGLGGYDWGDQAEDGPINFALMAYSSISSNFEGNPQIDLQDKGMIDSECSRHMIENMSYLTDYKEIDGGYVAFSKGGKIIGRDKFDDKVYKGFFVGYSLNCKAFRVFNNRTRIVEENLHIRFSENTPNTAGSGPNWLFDIDALTKSMNYKPVVAGNQSNCNVGTKACDDAESKSCRDDGFQPSSDDGKKVDEDPRQESECKDQEKKDNVNSTNNMPALEDISTFNFLSDHEDDDEEADMNTMDTSIQSCRDDGFQPSSDDGKKVDEDPRQENDDEEADMNTMDTSIQVSPTLTIRIHKDHPLDQVIRDLH
nr:hypothetical protein [Tanacetum cinerariifolium]